MAHEISIGNKLMVGFLRVMVFVLIVILIAIPVCILLDFLGVLEAIGFN
ncbi:hypothetical protein [Flagellimonas zhangzhouensis]|uniref:Uncharacterized protein n=1 Tax=Flagellimonas zhangzhouensis TaxID=1073328 RepID=A0A1H2WU13_9FLAO|nr:hypothetical protein [Allomuricauda zhangzhouensis]SDQ24712.1 hypothetical protein SAMN05216294_1054 [Allomuricauda zhangzhouensis]SDW83986.1 hypothetical protein SAMN04487892_2434 [Allomuricauda zhangzhouensis]